MTTADDLALRAEVIRLVRAQIRAGRYHPPAEVVAERLVAWLFGDGVVWARPLRRAGRPGARGRA